MIEAPIRFCPLCGTTLIERLHTGRKRPACPNCGWVYFPDPKVAVAVVILHNKHILLVQRKYDPQKDHWTLPSGFVDAGEDPKLAAARECFEETGLSVKDFQLQDVLYSQEHPRGASILIIYKAQVEAGELRAGDDAKQVAYFSKSNLPPLAFASTRDIIQLFL